MKVHTYRAYEAEPGRHSKTTELSLSRARQFADKLGVRWEWLLEGQAIPWREERSTAVIDAEGLSEEQLAVVRGVVEQLRKAS